MIPAERILLTPRPGTATEKDLLRINNQGRTLCELVDGVLVEKAMGWKESMLAAFLIRVLDIFVEQEDLGIVLGADGFLRLMPGLVRAPDVSFISWDSLGGDDFPDVAIGPFAPDLAVEVLSEGNTRKEMARKLDEYFSAGSQQVWLVYPHKKKVEVYYSPTKKKVLQHDQTLDGGEVLPGFSLPLARLFDRLRRRRSS